MGASKISGVAVMVEATAIVCGHVFRSERQVRLVVHHLDGVWQLVCGENDHPEGCSDFEPVGLEHLLERQKDLLDVRNLDRGWIAERDEFGQWFYRPDEE